MVRGTLAIRDWIWEHADASAPWTWDRTRRFWFVFCSNSDYEHQNIVRNLVVVIERTFTFLWSIVLAFASSFDHYHIVYIVFFLLLHEPSLASGMFGIINARPHVTVAIAVYMFLRSSVKWLWSASLIV